ncbi:MAG: putative metal-dependent hydrolase [Bacteroidetes bacterium]|nr:putative metal-dependent hydrolase [Bacteroidota bacterium]
MEKLKYPIGKFTLQKEYTKEQINEYILNIENLPINLKTILNIISELDFQKQYREGSWNIKQLVHHIGESHTNAYIRLKLALTEDNPIIKPYNETLWVNTNENNLLDAQVSIMLIEAIHLKFVCLAKSLDEIMLNRTFFNPQSNRTFRVSDLLCLYSWHGLHHSAHINLALGL